ncbi:hypothetical protein L5515_006770 [Caenorhabditis briggsae]|uniref:Uncharacterized protein n=1 Tax=Caenorhabditis briggsae TaxID=6238 RepID=A0AAE9F1B9_CAEBR|nr:hypothetical protein L5515_006770 [Caenorhabditis briggsae]
MIRENTFFQEQKLSVQKIVHIAADWVESPGRDNERTASLHGVTTSTIVNLNKLFRQLTEQWFERQIEKNPNFLLGGPGKIVEIDESHMYKAKYNRGHMLRRKSIWIFGMTERHTNKVAMFRVKQRDAATLLPIIRAHVKPGSMIVSDADVVTRIIEYVNKIVTWQDLPMRFKVDVATLLDRDSRLAFQLTSRAENDIVSRCPINLKSLSISSFYCGKRPIPEKQQFSFRYCVQLPNDRVAVTEKRYIRDRAVEEFVRIFKHKKTTVKTLRLTAGRRMDDFLKNAVAGIVELKKEQCPKFVIRVTEIDFHGNLVAEFCELLSFFDTSILMSIKIEGYDIEPEVVSMLVATEQFKKAKKVSIMPLVSVPIDNFLHLNTFEVKLASAKPEEKFQTEPLPLDSFFTIMAEREIDENFLVGLFEKMKLPEKSRYSISTHDYNHVSKHATPSSDNVFILKVDAQSIYGVIVSCDALKRLKMDVAVYLNLREFGFDFTDL